MQNVCHTVVWWSCVLFPHHHECVCSSCSYTEACIHVYACYCTCVHSPRRASQIYSLTSDFLKTASIRYAGDMFVSHDGTSDRPWGIMQVTAIMPVGWFRVQVVVGRALPVNARHRRVHWHRSVAVAAFFVGSGTIESRDALGVFFLFFFSLGWRTSSFYILSFIGRS